MRSNIVTEHIKLLDKVYGTKDPLVAARRKVHEHLGLTFYFSLKLDMAMTQCYLIKKMRNDFPDYLKGQYRVSPAPNNLLKTNEDGLD